MILKPSADQNVVSCNNLTFIRSINSGRWYSKLYNPPVAAQFLKEISFELNSGEVLGIVGSAGSGKSTLLKVVAHRLRGNIGGCLMLNGLVLTKEKFDNFCEYVSFKRRLLPSARVKAFLLVHADLVLTTKLNNAEKEKRVLLLMQEFDLLPYSEEKIGNLSESARRRFIITMHLIRDPVLIVIDDIVRDLEALSGYQLMYALNNYVRRTNRLAIVSMRVPRSDIYQLISRMTMLFYGEMVYSGPTKKLPNYFNQIGFPCPVSENPSVYYLSLATIDRETSERYLETQEQAHKLVQVFKSSQFTDTGDDSVQNDGYLFPSKSALCHLNRPNALCKLYALSRRSFSILRTSTLSTVSLLFSLPLLLFVISLFSPNFEVSSNHSPRAMASLVLATLFATSFVAVLQTAYRFERTATLIYQESSRAMYSRILGVVAFLVAMLPFSFIAVASSTLVTVWFNGLNFEFTSNVLLFVILWTFHLSFLLVTVGLGMLIRSPSQVSAIINCFNILSLVTCSGIIKSMRTFHTMNGWIYYITYASIHRYIATYLSIVLIPLARTNCTRDELRPFKQPLQFCRWSNGTQYLEEQFPDGMAADVWFNFWGTVGMFAVIVFVVCVAIAVPKPRMIKKKFMQE